jgi:hypothetical protein
MVLPQSFENDIKPRGGKKKKSHPSKQDPQQDNWIKAVPGVTKAKLMPLGYRPGHT